MGSQLFECSRVGEGGDRGGPGGACVDERGGGALVPVPLAAHPLRAAQEQEVTPQAQQQDQEPQIWHSVVPILSYIYIHPLCSPYTEYLSPLWMAYTP